MSSGATRWSLLAVAMAAMVAFSASIAGCARRGQVTPPNTVAVYFCKAGTETLVPVRYSLDDSLSPSQRAGFVVNQLLAGPSGDPGAVVLFPPGTRATVSLKNKVATVDLRGPLASASPGGASDEVALFKALTFSLTELSEVEKVQVLLNGRKRASLPGGHMEIDEPMTRETFSQ